MILVGLTGGIASGKSTVANMLREKGAVIIDADALGHQVYEAGTPGFRSVVDRFGEEIVAEDGSMDRKKLGKVVFKDAAARADLEAISHPEVFRLIAEAIERERDSDRMVVVDAALLVEAMPDRGRSMGIDALLVVSADPKDQLERMITERGMEASSAKARMNAQAPLERKLAAADYVIHNRGSIADLSASVDVLWDQLRQRFGEGD